MGNKLHVKKSIIKNCVTGDTVKLVEKTTEESENGDKEETVVIEEFFNIRGCSELQHKITKITKRNECDKIIVSIEHPEDRDSTQSVQIEEMFEELPAVQKENQLQIEKFTWDETIPIEEMPNIIKLVTIAFEEPLLKANEIICDVKQDHKVKKAVLGTNEIITTKTTIKEMPSNDIVKIIEKKTESETGKPLVETVTVEAFASPTENVERRCSIIQMRKSSISGRVSVLVGHGSDTTVEEVIGTTGRDFSEDISKPEIVERRDVEMVRATEQESNISFYQVQDLPLQDDFTIVLPLQMAKVEEIILDTTTPINQQPKRQKEVAMIFEEPIL